METFLTHHHLADKMIPEVDEFMKLSRELAVRLLKVDHQSPPPWDTLAFRKRSAALSGSVHVLISKIRRSGDLATVRGLVLKCVDADKEEALREAAAGGCIDVVCYLSEQCAVDANAQNEYRYTALMLAAQSGKVEVARYLVEQCEADVNAMNYDGFTPLMLAAESGEIDAVQYLAEKCGANMNVANVQGDTALMLAALEGKIGVARYLADHDIVNVESAACNGATALMYAASNEHVDIVRDLVDRRGANCTAQTNDGYTALVGAACSGMIYVVRYLAENCGADLDIENQIEFAVVKAAINGKTEVVKYLIQQNEASIRANDNKGNTALMLAARYGHVEVVRCLVDSVHFNESRYHQIENTDNVMVHCGAYVNTKNNEGYTALMWAAREGRIDVVRFLTEQSYTDVNTIDKNGWTAIMLAAQNGMGDVVSHLAEECSADVNIRSKDGNTAFRAAANRGYHDIERILTPFILPTIQISTDGSENTLPLSFGRYLCSSIPMSEIELTFFSQNDSIGGDFQAKWLDADAVVKLFIPDAAHSTFDDEVRMWQRLRHPNIIHMYGACDGPHVQFFVCEYASGGSLWEHMTLSSTENLIIWNDNMAKLSNFRLSRLMNTAAIAPTVGSMRWQAPEILKGMPQSFESDLYSLGMCIVEAVTGKIPWTNEFKWQVRTSKKLWVPERGGYALHSLRDVARKLVWQMCSQDPNKRTSLSSVVCELEQLAIQECSNLPQPKLELTSSFHDYQCGKLEEAWMKLKTRIECSDNDEYRLAFQQLKKIHKHLRMSTHNTALYARFYELLIDLYQIANMSPDQARMMRLSSTRATTNSLYALQWRIKSLLASLGVSLNVMTKPEAGREKQRTEMASFFASGVSDTILLLNNLKSEEERSAFLRAIKAEIEDHPNKYTLDQLEAMKKAYEDITAKLDGDDLSELAPEWFIPWYELVVDEWNCLGEGGFGSVNRAKWLDSEVVVKRVTLAGSRSANTSSAFDLSESDFFASADPSASQVESDAIKRTKALAMFRREVDIWFGFSHPHVVRLFGACHVGRPFFVCEFATNGTLVRYLRENPHELWSKLHEAALGVQYLHARGVVHGDLKGNNIVIGSDKKAKVTDFGLSSIASSKTEAVKAGKDPRYCLPWRGIDITAMKYHVTRGKLPSRPGMCEVREWSLVERMCVLDPEKRLKISTVVDELARLANVDVTDRLSDQKGTPTANSVKWALVTDAIATAQQLLTQLHDNENQSREVLSQYVLFWKRLEKIHSRLEVDASDDNYCASFCSLVADAKASTAMLRDRDNSLIAFAQTTMRCYALNRALSKLCDTYFISEGKMAKPAMD
ncbi:unnamed protein product [Phytophthora fragariaefolia]|uniref:Unnamed protein product n=1 Tax=Phytophthora fragariaefolia TaxID=1490495 RepID=A0A9W6UAW2_9STRA|nr:unnamed protein product [Phytophthora fragariaefolia]